MSHGFAVYLCEEIKIDLSDSDFDKVRSLYKLYCRSNPVLPGETITIPDIISLSSFNISYKNTKKRSEFIELFGKYPEIDDFHYIDLQNKVFYKRILSLDYGYELFFMAEALRLEEFPNHDKRSFRRREISDLSQALKYLLSHSYNDDTEVILDNPFIESIGDHYLPYYQPGYMTKTDKMLQKNIDSSLRNMISLLDIAGTATLDNNHRCSVVVERFD
jgi:hypothetical protein